MGAKSAHRAGVRLSADVDAAIVAAYADGQSTSRIASDFGVHPGMVSVVVRRAGGNVRSNEAAHRVYRCDHHYFDTIDTEHRAYWLGFVAADGCVHSQNRLSFMLAAKDREHLLRFREALGATHPITDCDNNGYPGVKFNVRSAELVAALAHHGVTPRKSLTESPPTTVPANLMRHFWRGFFDGDGCIYLQGKAPKINIIGGHPMVEAFAAFARAASGTTARVAPTRTRASVFAVCGLHVVRAILRVLYADASVSLGRKRVLFERVDALPTRAAPRRTGTGP